MISNPDATGQKKIVVTGASGFVGRSLVKHLTAAGHHITAIAGKNAAKIKNVDRVLSMDLSQSTLPSDLLADDTILIHLAAVVSRGGKSGLVNDSVNVKIAQNIVDANPRNLIVLSSIAAAVTETNIEAARQYGFEKAAVDVLFREKLVDSQMVILRPPAIYGPDMGGPVTTLAGLVKRGLPLPLGAARTPRPYLSIGNLNSLFHRLVEIDTSQWKALSRQPIEVHDGQLIATDELIRHLAHHQDVDARLLPVPVALLRAGARLAGKAHLVAGALDAVRCEMPVDLLKDIGWAPAEQMPDSLSFLSPK